MNTEVDQLATEAISAEGLRTTFSVLSMAATLGSRKLTADMLMVPTAGADQPGVDTQARVLIGSVIAWALSQVVRGNELADEMPNRPQHQVPSSPGPSPTVSPPLSPLPTMCMSPATSRRSVFDCPGDKTPSITIERYVDRFARYTPCSREVFVLSLVLVDRICSCSPEIRLSRRNVHRLFIASFVVASKFQDDVYFSNGFYSRVAGISTNELNSLEREFLWRVGFCLNADVQTFGSYLAPTDLLCQVSRRYGDLTGFFTGLIRELRAGYAAFIEKQRQEQLFQQQQQQTGEVALAL